VLSQAQPVAAPPLSCPGAPGIYLACGATDLRKSIDGLAALVCQAYQLDPFTESLFVFCNKDRDKIKILRWDHNGFWLYYKRLERGRFGWPASADPPVKSVSRRQLGWLLEGLALEQPRAHQAVMARTVG
jgi:transposase